MEYEKMDVSLPIEIPTVIEILELRINPDAVFTANVVSDIHVLLSTQLTADLIQAL
jgi:hypothetical protein